MKILAIETSCDDTCCALLDVNQQSDFKILSNIMSSQIKVHAKFGGVVPSLAAREHVKNILPCLEECCGFAPTGKDVDLIAVTMGPGLAPALLVGLTAAKTLSYIWQKPLIGVNHLEGHIAANFINNSQLTINNSQKLLPVMCLIVSGGHTLLVLIKKFGDYQILGETRDDAAGEAFDKIARILGLGYPGGPAVAAGAAQITNYKFQISNKLQKSNNKPKTTSMGEPFKIKLPRPMLGSGDYDFSFSGLKTAVLYNFKIQPEKVKKSKNYIQTMCGKAQQAIVDVLVAKTVKAAQEFKVKSVMMAGGVAANQSLRQSMATALHEKYPQARLILPELRFCTDNALMIALAAFFKTRQHDLAMFKNSWRDLKIAPNARLD